MTFYLIIAGMLFLSGMIFGQNINMTFIWWVNITSITASFFTIAGIGFAYKAYKVWHRPILSELTGSLSEVMLNRELAYAKLIELIYFSSHNSNTENVIDEKRLVAFHSFHISDQALWSRGSYLVKSIVLYEASSSSLIDYWSEYNFNEIITNCINEKIISIV
ncbi:hypothetical protein [Shewanella sp. 1180_01]|uniref:hypothetical protein n=1 Tax=Shewanella sp. 1180_01 TaxID=2604451 RepID=UPI0040635910